VGRRGGILSQGRTHQSKKKKNAEKKTKKVEKRRNNNDTIRRGELFFNGHTGDSSALPNHKPGHNERRHISRKQCTTQIMGD
jgi:hypothetical protein